MINTQEPSGNRVGLLPAPTITCGLGRRYITTKSHDTARGLRHQPSPATPSHGLIIPHAQALATNLAEV